MGLGVALATAYVRLRPNLAGFATEATAGVKASLSEVQAQANAVARANVAADMQNVEANRALAVSYKEIGAAAARGSEEAAVATRLAAESTASANALIGRSAAVASEQTLGLKRHLLSLSNALGIGIGAVFAVKFIKDVVGTAASIQKSTEVIRSGFGRAGAAVVEFGGKGAAALGISKEVADATSARFAILFKNIGIGRVEGAGMTVNLERLAGALSAIRGVDPTRALQSITLAMLGNVRSLKQLGVAVDPATEKVAAFRLGLISSVKDALTPAVRAQAIYALATAHLGQFMDQAKRHAGDLANVQRRLSAEFSNAKDALGTALLPIFLKYTRELANWLSKMEKSGKLQKAFNSIVQTTVSVVKAVASVISTGWKIFQTAAGWVGGTTNAVKILLATLAVSKIMGISSALVSGLVTRGILLIGPAAAAAEGETLVAFGGIAIGAEATGVAIKAALISTGIGAVVVAAGIAAVLIIEHFNTIKRWIREFGRWLSAHARELLAVPIIGQFAFLVIEIVKNFGTIKSTVRSFAHFFARVFIQPIQSAIKQFEAFKNKLSSLFGLGGGGGGFFGQLLSPLNFVPGGRILGDALGSAKKLYDAFHKQAPSVLSGKGKENPIFDSVLKAFSVLSGAAPALNKAAKKLHDTVVDTIVGGTSTGVGKAMSDATASAIQAANKAIVAAVQSAERNLNSLGNKLSETIAKIADKLGLTGSMLANSPQAAAFKKLKDLIANDAPSFEIARASQALSSDLQGVGKSTLDIQKTKIKAQITALTTALNTGKITASAFDKRVAELLKANHLTFNAIAKMFGKDFARQFEANVHALREQAAAITAVPSKFRREANQQGGDGGLFRIVHPLETIRQQDAKLGALAQKQRERIAKAAEKTAANTAALKHAPPLGKLPLPGSAAKHAGNAAHGSAAP